MRRHRLGVAREHLAQRLQRAVGVALACEQQLRLQQAGAFVVGLALQHLVEQGERALEVLLGGLQPRLHDDRRRVAGLREQGAVRQLGRLPGIVLHRIGDGQARRQVGNGLGALQFRVRKLREQLAVVADHQHRAGEVGHDLLLCDAELLRLRQLDDRGHRVARLDQRATEQQPALGRIGVLLEQGLELDRRGGGVLLLEKGLRRGQQILLGLALAAGGDQGSQHERGGGDGA